MAKIKLDYVTNSSSVSFCMWGIRYNLDYYYHSEINPYLPNQLIEKAYANYLAKNNPFIAYKKFEDKIENDDPFFFREHLINFIEDNDLSCFKDAECGLLYIGNSPFDIPNDINRQQYIELIKERFLKIGIYTDYLKKICNIISKYRRY